MGSFAGVRYGEAATAALRLAAADRSPGEPLGTGAVLAALARVDNSGEWGRLWLHAGGVILSEVRAAADVEPTSAVPAGQWEGVPLTYALTRSLELAEELAGRYRLSPLPPGALALALLADATAS